MRSGDPSRMKAQAWGCEDSQKRRRAMWEKRLPEEGNIWLAGGMQKRGRTGPRTPFPGARPTGYLVALPPPHPGACHGPVAGPVFLQNSTQPIYCCPSPEPPSSLPGHRPPQSACVGLPLHPWLAPPWALSSRTQARLRVLSSSPGRALGAQ